MQHDIPTVLCRIDTAFSGVYIYCLFSPYNQRSASVEKLLRCEELLSCFPAH